MTPGPADQLTSINTQIVQYIEVLLALGGVLVLAYVILRVGLPRMFGMRTSSGGPIQILARYPLEPKKALYLVKAGTQVFLIGTSESQVQYLTAIAADNTEEVLRFAQSDEAPRKDFRQILTWFQKGGQG
jgi:flagellar biogenesis protein FliO